MIIGKEALVNLELLFKQQGQVYPDSADFGIELTDNMLNALRADTKTLKGIYSGENYSPAPDYQGVKDIIIPIEERGYGESSTDVYRCIKINVLVSRQFTTIAFINIESELLGANSIPFFNKEAA